MVEFSFRLTGLPPQDAIKVVDIDVNRTVADAKRRVHKAYKLDPFTGIHLLFGGKPLQDHVEFARLFIHSLNVSITVVRFKFIPDKESLEGVILPSAPVEMLFNKIGVGQVNEEVVKALGEILGKVGAEIIIGNELKGLVTHRLVQERMENLQDILSRERIFPLPPVSRMIQKARRFIGGPGKVNPHHMASERLELIIGAILEDIGLEIVEMAKNLAEQAHRKAVNAVDIQSAFTQWRKNF